MTSERPYHPLTDGFTVEPGQDGSFIVYGICSNAPRAYDCPRWGFSNAGDLLKWLQRHVPQQQQQQQQQAQQGLKDRLLAKHANGPAGDSKPIPLPAPADYKHAKRRRAFGLFSL